MKVLRFILKGDHAFFKKPDVNSFVYFTYSNIHKIAVLGMFGAILGLGGYNQQDCKNDMYPEFYEKLKDIKISITPKLKSGNIFSKKIQTFNNTVGYANEDGGTLIIKEQWLENPEWEIYVKIDSEIAQELCDSIMNRKSVYIPYLGKNDHFAIIENMKIYDDVKTATSANEVNKLSCLYLKDMIELSDEYPENEVDAIFKYSERLPYRLEETTNQYEYQKFIYTNMEVEKFDKDEVYCISDIEKKYIVFY